MMNKVSRAFAILMCVLISAMLISFSVSARGYVDVDIKASLTINYVSQNADFSIYKVGDINTLGELSLSGDFAKYPVSLDNDRDSWSELAITLEGYVASDVISPLKTGRTDADKMLNFSDLSVGLYLVIGENTVETENNTQTVYSPSPFLICLPNIVDESSEWIYDVSARPKYEVIKAPTTTEKNTEISTEDNSKPYNTVPNTTEPDDNPKLPQTGLLWWPVGLLSVAGMALILAGVIRKTKSDNK